MYIRERERRNKGDREMEERRRTEKILMEVLRPIYTQKMNAFLLVGENGMSLSKNDIALFVV